MARSSPQSFEKRQRERRKREKRAAKMEARLIRAEEKRWAKENAGQPLPPRDEDGYLMDKRYFEQLEKEQEEQQ